MTERNFSAQLAGKFVDDDDLIRTGRAWVEIDGFDFLHIPVPTGFDETMGAFESQAAQVAKDAEASGKYASAAKSSASDAAASASRVAGIDANTSRDAAAARDSATRAETAAGNAKTSETNASSSASGAKSSATSASSSAGKAATSEQNAAKSASAASGSANSAKQDADRAANIAGSTSWDGDRLTVNGKTSPSLRGPKGDPGEVTKSQLNTAIATAVTALAPTGLKLVLAAPDDKTAEQADTAIRTKGYQAVVVVPTTGNWWE